MNRLRRWWNRDEASDIPGVVYYDRSSEVKLSSDDGYQGFLKNLRLDTLPSPVADYYGPKTTRPGPEVVPYTWAERFGLVPVHPSRIRPRQYYHPTTDFNMYDYDTASPEERHLTARWMSRILDFNATVPLLTLSVGTVLSFGLPAKVRLPVLIVAALTGVFGEVTRAFLAASQERQDLDDYILAKEIWYMKNVETYQLQLPRMARGSEEEFRSFQEQLLTMPEQERAAGLPKDLEAFLRGGPADY